MQRTDSHDTATDVPNGYVCRVVEFLLRLSVVSFCRELLLSGLTGQPSLAQL
jgi:hypothetical protein